MRPLKHHCHLPAAVLISLLGIISICDAKTPFQDAHRFIEAGQLSEARRALKTELRLRPANVEARYNLAILLEEMRHTEEAFALYRENLQHAWHMPSIVNMASILQRQGKTGEARNWLEKATKKVRFEATPWYLLADMAEQEGNIGKAADLHSKALKTDPLNGFAWLRSAAFQSRHKLSDKGIKHGGRAVRLLPDCAPCWQQYGNILRAAGEPSEALEAFQRSLAIEPNSDTRLQLIGVLHDLGRHERAERMQKGLDARPGSRQTEEE